VVRPGHLHGVGETGTGADPPITCLVGSSTELVRRHPLVEGGQEVRVRQVERRASCGAERPTRIAGWRARGHLSLAFTGRWCMELGELFIGFVLGFIFRTHRKPIGFLLGFFLSWTTTLSAVLTSGTDPHSGLLDLSLYTPVHPQPLDQFEELVQHHVDSRALVRSACPRQAMNLLRRDTPLRSVVPVEEERVRAMLHHAQVSGVAGVIAEVALVVVHAAGHHVMAREPLTSQRRFAPL